MEKKVIHVSRRAKPWNLTLNKGFFFFKTLHISKEGKKYKIIKKKNKISCPDRTATLMQKNVCAPDVVYTHDTHFP